MVHSAAKANVYIVIKRKSGGLNLKLGISVRASTNEVTSDTMSEIEKTSERGAN